MQYPKEIDDREKSGLKIETSEDGQERTNMVNPCIVECNISHIDDSLTSSDWDKNILLPVTEVDAKGNGQQSLDGDQTAGFEHKLAQQMNVGAPDGDRNMRKDGVSSGSLSLTSHTLQSTQSWQTTSWRMSSTTISDEVSTLNDACIQMNRSAAICGDNNKLSTNSDHTESRQSLHQPYHQGHEQPHSEEFTASSQHCTVKATQTGIEDGSVHIPVSEKCTCETEAPHSVTECHQRDQCNHPTNLINNVAEMNSVLKFNVDKEMAATDNLPMEKPQNSLPIQVSTGTIPYLVEKVSSCDGSRTTAGSRVAVSCEDTRHDTNKINTGFHDYPIDQRNDDEKQKPPGEEFGTAKMLVRHRDKKEMEVLHPCDTVSCQQHEKDDPATATNFTIASELSKMSGHRYREMIVDNATIDTPEKINSHSADEQFTISEGTGLNKDKDNKVDCQIQIPTESIPQYEDCDNKTLDVIQVGDQDGSGGLSKLQLLVDSPLKRKTFGKEGTSTSLARPYLKGFSGAEDCEDQNLISVNKEDACDAVRHPKNGNNTCGTTNRTLELTETTSQCTSSDAKTSTVDSLSGEKLHNVKVLSIQGPTAHINTGEDVSVSHDTVVNPILCLDKEASIGSSESKLGNQTKDSPIEKQPKAKEDQNLNGSFEWRNDDDDLGIPIVVEFKLDTNVSHAEVSRMQDQDDHATDKSSNISSKEKTNSTELNSEIEAMDASAKVKPQVAVPVQVKSQTIESQHTCSTTVMKSGTISEQNETNPTTSISEPYNLTEPKENSSTIGGELNTMSSSPGKEMKLKAYVESMKIDKCTHGVTPLHLASKQGYLDAVKVLVEEFGFDPTVRDLNYQETPLHCACQNGYLSIVKYFVDKHCCDVETQDMSGLTPLHFASRKGHINIVKYLSNEQNCNLQARDKLQQTALHYACHFGHTTVVRFFVQEKRCDPEIADCEMRTPLHLACKYRHSEIVQYLILEEKCNPNSKDIKNMTPLHYTCIWWKHITYTHDRDVSLGVAEALLQDPRCDVNKRTNDGNTALHLACKTDRLSIVRHLLFNQKCNPNIKNRAGELPLHLTSHLDIISELTANGANPILSIMYKRQSIHDTVVRTPCLKSWNSEQVRELTLGVKTPQELFIWLAEQVSEHQAVEAIQSIIEHTSFNFNGLFSNGYNTLHIACKANKPQMVNCLLSLGNCNPNTNTRSGDSPLELSSNLQVIRELLQYGAQPICKLRQLMFTEKKEDYLLDIMKFLTEEAKWELDIALQLACEANRPKVVQFLLEKRKCDPNSSNSAKRNLLQLTSNPEIIKILLQYGANPTDVYRFHSNILGTKQPLRPSVKVFIVGNPSVGKSTLTVALQNEPFLEMLSIAKKVSGVDEKTAGVIPYEFHSRKYGRITMYDFAGHREFYGSHAALISNAIQSSPPIFIIVVNVNEDDEKIKRNSRYWLSFIENQCSSLTIVNKPHVIIVGSHADLLQARGDDPKEKQHIVDMTLKEVPYASIECVGFVTMNCCYSNSPGMKKLRNFMKRSCSSVRSQTINFTVHCFQVYLQDKFRDHVAIRLKSIQKQVQSDLVALQGGTTDTTFTCFIPSDLEELCKFCKELSDQGHILYLHNSSKVEEGWVIIDKESLLKEVTGTVFAPSNFKEHRNLASSTGVVPFSKIKDSFCKHNPEMIVGYLTHLEFCHEILDVDIVKLIDKHQTYVCLQSERYFFFPALVTMEIPDKVWKSKPQQFSYHCGWLLQCVKPERFFTSRFLEVLLLRLAFSFALAKSPNEIDQTFPAIQRECSIWKNGIFWGSKLGPEVLVEVCFNEAVIILMRCEDIHLMKCIEGRPKVIFEVLKCAKEFCPKVQTQEFFIDPSEVTEYPLIKETLSELTRYPIEKIAKIAINSGEMESLVCTTGSISLRHLLRLEPYAILKKQLTQTLLQEPDETRVSDTLVNDISECGCQNANFIKMFDSRPGVESSEVKLYFALRKWRDESEGTFFRLRDKFSQYTIFAGRELDMLVSYINLCCSALALYKQKG